MTISQSSSFTGASPWDCFVSYREYSLGGGSVYSTASFETGQLIRRVLPLCRDTVFVNRPTNRKSVAQGLFRWVREQGQSPDAPVGSKNASNLVSIPLKRGKAWGTAPWGLKMSVKAHLDQLPPETEHTRPDPFIPKHGRSKCVVAGQFYWSLTMRLFCVKIRILVGWVSYSSAEM